MAPFTGPTSRYLIKAFAVARPGIVQHLSCRIKWSFGTKVSSKISKISAEEVRRPKAQLHGPSVEVGALVDLHNLNYSDDNWSLLLECMPCLPKSKFRLQQASVTTYQNHGKLRCPGQSLLASIRFRAKYQRRLSWISYIRIFFLSSRQCFAVAKVIAGSIDSIRNTPTASRRSSPSVSWVLQASTVRESKIISISLVAEEEELLRLGDGGEDPQRIELLDWTSGLRVAANDWARTRFDHWILDFHHKY